MTVHFFKPSGKWYCTEAMDWLEEADDATVRQAFIRTLKTTLGTRLWGMTAVCIEPGGRNAHPQMLRWDEGVV